MVIDLLQIARFIKDRGKLVWLMSIVRRVLLAFLFLRSSLSLWLVFISLLRNLIYLLRLLREVCLSFLLCVWRSHRIVELLCLSTVLNQNVIIILWRWLEPLLQVNICAIFNICVSERIVLILRALGHWALTFVSLILVCDTLVIKWHISSHSWSALKVNA